MLYDLQVDAASGQEIDDGYEATIEATAKHQLRSGKQVLTVRTSQKPGIAALAPFHKRIERNAGNNSLKIATMPGGLL
ncbi:MAG: hypothetical protein AB7U82_25980 [Blastocatellales bacterium]